MPKSVEDYLNEIDYSELAHYVPSQFAINYINFVKIISAENPDMMTPPLLHYKMIDGLVTKKRRVVNLCSRGLAKTSLFGEILVLYLAVFRELPNLGEVNVVMYVADSMDNGAKNFRNNVQSRWERSAFLQKYVPKASFTDEEIVFTNSSGKKLYIVLFGAKSGVRGVKKDTFRPELAICDDLVSDEDSRSPARIQAIKEVLHSGVVYALNPMKHRVILNGTPFGKGDPVYEAVESGHWHVNVYPICNKFPCVKEEFVGAWGERFDYDYCEAQYTYNPSSFKKEMLLRIAAEEDRMIANKDIRRCTAKDIYKDSHKYNWYITTDFAVSSRAKADYTFILVWAVDSKKNRYMVDGFFGRVDINESFNQLFMFAKKYKPMGVGVEVSGQQGAFLSLLRTEMERRGIWFPLARNKENRSEGIPARTNKMERFRLTLPAWKTGKIHLPVDAHLTEIVRELIDEIEMVTLDAIKAKHDDGLDAISQLEQMYVVYPSESEERTKPNTTNTPDYFAMQFEDDSGDDGIRNYLV